MDTQSDGDTSSANSPVQPSPFYWSAEVESILEGWQKSGYCSLGDDMYSLQSSGYIFSKSDLHLIYNALWSGGQNPGAASEYTVWASRMPKLLMAAGNATFFIHAMLGFGSLSLAWDPGSQDAKSLGYRHGGMALQGLQTAINVFSQDNADAVLASSVVLSWQANDFHAWHSLISGIRTVVNRMADFRSGSRLPELIDQLQLELLTATAYEQNVQVLQGMQLNYQNVLEAIVLALDHLQPYTDGRQEHNMIEQMRDYVQRLLGLQLPHTAEEQFCHLYALRKWLFWIPSTVLKDGRHDWLALIFVAHLYAVALAIEPLFPDVAGPMVSAISLPPLEQILRAFERFDQNRNASTAVSQEIDNMLSLIMWPRQVASAYRSRRYDLTFGNLALSRSPIGFDAFSSDLMQASATFNMSQPSPAFPPNHAHSLSTSSTWSSSSGNVYLDLPMLSSSLPSVGRSYTTPVLPSMSSGYNADEFLYEESNFDYNTGFVYSPPPVWT